MAGGVLLSAVEACLEVEVAPEIELARRSHGTAGTPVPVEISVVVREDFTGRINDPDLYNALSMGPPQCVGS
jgi:hypothetical protein